MKCNNPFFVNPIQLHLYKVPNNHANKSGIRKHCDKSFVYIDEITGYGCHCVFQEHCLYSFKEAQKFICF